MYFVLINRFYRFYYPHLYKAKKGFWCHQKPFLDIFQLLKSEAYASLHIKPMHGVKVPKLMLVAR
jgi:hypothetical protein